MKADAFYNEKWLQTELAKDPSLLGLGDLDVRDIERKHPSAGRLDLLLSDPEAKTRYEVEIQLGATDESHIIRTIEYWDIERTRYPQYEHVAVIVAEDITSRFLNVISLFNKAIPLIAIQMRALDVGGVCTLTATTVLDITRLGTAEEDEPSQAVDRSYWVSRGSEETVALAEEVLKLVNEVAGGRTLKYNKHYVGLARDGVADNFVNFRPRKNYLATSFRIRRNEETTAIVDDSELDPMPYDNQWGYYRVRLTPEAVRAERGLVLGLIRKAAGMAESPPLASDTAHDAPTPVLS